MICLILLTVFALASSASSQALYTPPGSTSSRASSSRQSDSFRSGEIPDFSSGGNSGASFDTGSDGVGFGIIQQLPRRNVVQTLGGSNVQTGFSPRYEEHVIERSGLVPVTTTITNKVTRTHTLRVPSTSDVWVTSVTMMKMPVTQLTTQRSYVPVTPNTVTSVIRITKTPIEVVTRTEEIYPTKTLVSVFTRFVTETDTVELWQNIVHRATNYQVLTVPVVETQTLLQRLFTTTTVTRVVNITSVQPLFTRTVVPRAGELPQVTATHTYGR